MRFIDYKYLRRTALQGLHRPAEKLKLALAERGSGALGAGVIVVGHFVVDEDVWVVEVRWYECKSYVVGKDVGETADCTGNAME
jgi:hypothetical protein